MSETRETDPARDAFTVADARRFIAGIDSDYFHEVCVALRSELEIADPPQAVALDTLRERLGKIRDLLEKRLVDGVRT